MTRGINFNDPREPGEAEDDNGDSDDGTKTHQHMMERRRNVDDGTNT